MQNTDKQTILLVESDTELKEAFLEKFKEKLEFTTLTARDGVEALGKIRRQKFDLIIIESCIQKKNIAEVINETKESESNQLTQIFVLSDEDNIESTKQKIKHKKRIQFLIKPVRPDELLEKATALFSKSPPKKKFKLDVDFINPFIESAIDTMEKMCKAQDLEHGSVYLLGKDEQLDIDISGTLKISSPYFKGLIAISYSDDVYQKLVLGALEGKEEGVDITNQDAAAEMINIVFGKTKAELNTKGYKIERAIPNVLRGSGHKIQSTNAPILLLPFNSNAGKFFIQISVQAS
jgi:chemotaxis protein CheX